MYRLSDDDRKRPFFTRKRIMFLLLALLIIVSIPTGIFLFLQQQQQSTPGMLRKGTPNNLSPVGYVDPLIGTWAQPQDLALGGFAVGNVFPGASYPHGLVQWRPDNAFTPGGYRYNESLIRGFSLTHFSGRGCIAYEDFPFMPSVGQI